MRVQRPNTRPPRGIALALAGGVSESTTPLVYDEPTVMWRMQRAAGQVTHAEIGSSPSGPVVVWYVNGRPLGFRTFDDWTAAIEWSAQLQAQNWAAGWRLVPE